MGRVVNLTDKHIATYRKRAVKYASGKGRVNPKWLKLPEFDEEFMNSGGAELSKEELVEIYPFDAGTSSELKFRILAIQRLCCGLVDGAEEYKVGLDLYIRDILRGDEKLRSKLGINWISPVDLIMNNLLEDRKNEDKNR